MIASPIGRILIAALAFAAILMFASAAAVAEPTDDYKKHPGYVDFEAMGVFDNLEATVEVFLKDVLLDLARSVIEHEDPELAEIISSIVYVHVQQFELDRGEGEQVAAKTKEMATQLDKKGWEVVVRVREKYEQTYVYIKPGEEKAIDGLVVMVVDDDREATFVNIVGSINPEDIGRVTGHFYGDSDFNINFGDDDRDDDDDDKDDRRNKRRH